MIKKKYLVKIIRQLNYNIKGRPILLSDNGYNLVYCCNSNVGKLIVKISVNDGISEKYFGLGKKYLTNEFLFKSFLLRNKNIPKILIYDQTKSFIPYSYIVYKKIYGNDLASLVDNKNINFKNLSIIYKNMGKELNSIHKIKFPTFGDLSNLTNIKNKNTDWYNFLSGILEKSLKKIRYGYFSNNYSLLNKYIKKNIKLFMNVKIKPTLLHGDYEAWNIIVKKNNTVSIIDSELSFCGHNLMDLVPEYPSSVNVAKRQILEQLFLRGYFLKRKPTSWESKCMDFYRDVKILTLRMAVWGDFIKTISKKEMISEENKINKVLENIKNKI